MKNTLNDLNNYLFEQIENINDEDLSEEQLEKTIKKTEAVTKVAETIIKNNELQLKAAALLSNNGLLKTSALPLLLGKNIIPEKDIEKI